MTVKKNPWKKVNRCVICGTKLQFKESLVPDASPQEGWKFCAQNHEEFLVRGQFEDGTFTIMFFVPGVKVI